MTVTRLTDPDHTRTWLTAGLDQCRVGPRGADAVAFAGPLLAAAAAQLARLPPPGAFVDISRLCLDPRATLATRPPSNGLGGLRTYEDTVLGRLATDPLRLAVADALAGLPEALRVDGLVVLLQHVLERIGFTNGVVPHPGAVRSLERLTREDWPFVPPEAPEQQLLRDGYQALVDGFRQVGRALVPADVTVLEQLPLLQRRSDRLALAQVSTRVDLLAAGLPPRARATRRRAGHVSTKLLDDSAYPVGGFSAIATSGSIENLVTSELALMEDDEPIDLFDVRYTEGELLFYTRDETAFVRGRRRFVVVLADDLRDARYRDPDQPVQRIVVAIAWVIVLATTLIRWLAREELLIRIVFPRDALQEERRLLTWALSDGLQTGTIVLEDDDDLEDRILSDARQAPVDRIVLQTSDAPVSPLPDTWTTVLRVAAIPQLTTPFAGEHPPAPTASAGWHHTLTTALAELM